MTVGTGRRSPAVARRVREDLEALFADARLARLLDRLAALRASLPRGERAARLAAAVKGFAVEVRLRFPDVVRARRRCVAFGDQPSPTRGDELAARSVRRRIDAAAVASRTHRKRGTVD